MIKDVQYWLETAISNQEYWSLDGSLTSQLEVLNIISLTPDINFKILNIKKAPEVSPNSY